MKSGSDLQNELTVFHNWSKPSYTQNLRSLPQRVWKLGIFRHFWFTLKILDFRMQKEKPKLIATHCMTPNPSYLHYKLIFRGCFISIGALFQFD